jgi:hypothetical protein
VWNLRCPGFAPCGIRLQAEPGRGTPLLAGVLATCPSVQARATSLKIERLMALWHD